MQGPLREPDEIISTAANALEYQANALEAGERLRNELGGSLEPFHSSVQRKRGPR